MGASPSRLPSQGGDSLGFLETDMATKHPFHPHPEHEAPLDEPGADERMADKPADEKKKPQPARPSQRSALDDPDHPLHHLRDA
jgi:hypothetical protein